MSDTASQLPEPPVEVDLSGRKLGDFQLLRRLGRGAMADVYLADQGSLRRQVAIKVLKSHLATDEGYVRRFHHEAQAAASLVHANIVQIHDVGYVDGIHYIAQEYVQGQNLREWLVRHGPADVKLAVAVLRQVAAALMKAGERGIVHRDVKPENIMIARTGEVKVADFGLARITRSTDALNLTQVGVTMGTPLYMSPEQVEGRPLDPRSDMYSLGVTAFHMLTGAPPFRGETALSVAVQHLKSQPERLENLRPDLPPALCRIVHRMLAKDPAERFSTPRELLRELRNLPLEGLDEAWDPDDEVLESAELASLTARQAATQQLDLLMKTSALQVVKRRRSALWLALGLIAAFLLGGLIAWGSRKPSLLADARYPSVPKQKTAQEQFFIAQMQVHGKEDHLRSVSDYFPKDEYYAHLAERELCVLYVQQDRYREALAILDKFATLGDDFVEFRAFGLAGRAVLFTFQKKYDDAARAMAELYPIRDKLVDRRMRQLLDELIKANRMRLNEATAKGWGEFLATRLPEEDRGGG